MNTTKGLIRGGVLAAASLPLCTGTAIGQVTADRVYYGINRSIPMTVTVPEGLVGAVKIQLLEPVTAAVRATADAAPGAVNLATLFPELWTASAPKLCYAQLVVGEEKVGPAVVLQPLLDPGMAFLNRSTGQAQFAPAGERPYSGLRAYVDKQVVFETDKGSMQLRMRPDMAPNTAWNFMRLVEGGLYTDILFHRIVAALQNGAPFVIQVGDPTGTGGGGPGYFIDLEKSTLPHDFGVLSMARTQEPNTNGSQVFICLSREGTSFLDGQYTSFAEAVSGTDVILALAAVPVGAQDRPLTPPVLKSAKLVDAPPHGTGAAVVKRPDAKAQPR